MTTEKIRLIETKYPVETVSYKGMQVWPFIRFSLLAYYQSGIKPIEANSLSSAKVASLIKQLFYGFPSYFRGYDYIALSDTSERKFLGGKWVDKSVDYILSRLPSSLLIELPLPHHYKKSQIPTKNIASKLPLYALETVYSKLFLRHVPIENAQLMDEVLRELDVQFDYHSVLARNIAQYHVGRLMNWLYRPKALIVQCSYTNIGLLKAFKDSQVPVIEVQHGLITSSHEAYNVFKRFDPSFFPDYFLSYGATEKEIFKDSHFLPSHERAVPIGHFYLDAIAASKRTKADVIPEAMSYAASVSITGQTLPVEKRLVEFIIQIAKEIPGVCFFYIPRNKNSYVFEVDVLPKNLINAYGRDTYETIRLTSFHTTIFSTCAIEALALGTPNILIDIDGLARKHFLPLLAESNFTFFVDSLLEYKSILNNHVAAERQEIISQSSKFILAGYKLNVDNFLRKELGIEPA